MDILFTQVSKFSLLETEKSHKTSKMFLKGIIFHQTIKQNLWKLKGLILTLKASNICGEWRWIQANTSREHLGELWWFMFLQSLWKKFCSERSGVAKYRAKRHAEAHIEALIYSCSDCGKIFRSKRTLENHWKTHQ